jgi:predicted amidohydrolase
VIGPTGDVEAALGAAPGLLVHDVDLGRLGPVRQSLPVLANRRL